MSVDEQTIQSGQDTLPPVESDLPSELRCAFVPRGAGPRVIYGQDDDGNLIHIQDARRGRACALVCPDCGGQLEAKKGTRKDHHFAHATRAECAKAGETALHRIAKEIIEESGRLRLPEVGLPGLKRYEVIHREDEVTFDRVEVEPLQEGFRPDVIGIKERTVGGKTTDIRLIIEIRVTHKVDDEKRSLLENNRETAIEIDFSKVDRAITRAELSQLLLTSADRKWIFHWKIAAREKEIKAIREREAQAEKEKIARKKARSESIVRAQEEAKARPPRGAIKEHVEFAEKELMHWRAIGMDDVLFSGGDDSYFDVEPFVWRTMVLGCLSPWGGVSDGWLQSRDASSMARGLGMKMREMGWAKGPFARENLRRYNKRKFRLESWDPLGDEILRLLRKAHNRLCPTSRVGDASLNKIHLAICAAHKNYYAFVTATDELASSLSRHGIELRFHGRLVNDASDVNDVLRDLPDRKELISHRDRITVLTKMVELEAPEVGLLARGAYLERLGIDVRLMRDQANGARDRAWKAIEQHHQHAWDARLEEWSWDLDEAIRETALALINSYQDLSEKVSHLQEAITSADGGFLFDSGLMQEKLTIDRRPNSFEDLQVLKKEVRNHAQNYVDFGYELAKLVKLCRGVEDRNLSLRVMELGCALAVKGFFENRATPLPGISTKHDLEAILREIDMLMQKSKKFGYGEDFAARALYSYPPDMHETLIETIFLGRVQTYRKAFRDIGSKNSPPKWVYQS